VKPNVLGINGSLRSGSLNGYLLAEALSALGDGVSTSIADIKDLPLYNGDLDGESKPAPVDRFLHQVKSANALLMVTPEYNYSISGALKNAIDWVSRPAYKSPLAHKPTGIMGASMSPIGTARAQSHLKQILAGTVTPVFPYPEFLVGAAHTKFDATGKLSDDQTAAYLARYAAAFVEWLNAAV